MVSRAVFTPGSGFQQPTGSSPGCQHLKCITSLPCWGPTNLHPQFFPMFLSHLTLCPRDTLSTVLLYFFHHRHPLCCPLLLLPSIFPSIRVFSCESALHIRWPKHWNFSISRSHEYSGLISFKIDWFDLLAVQGTLKSLLQHRNLKASIL